MQITIDLSTLSHINTIVGYFFFAFTGAYLHELLSMYKGNQRDATNYKIIIGTIVGGLLFIIIKDKYFISYDYMSTLIINIFAGTIGYELYNKCSSLEQMKNLAKDIHDIISNILDIDDFLKNGKQKKK